MQNIAEALSRILASMGDSSDKVAAAVEAKAIQGVRNTVRMLNPIVRYVESVLLLSSRGMDLTERDTLRFTTLDGTFAAVPLPQAVKDFLEAFDAGTYPQLELAVNQG